MLKLDSLPKETRRLFDYLSSVSEIKNFTLIGGTALALQFGHRNSEDLDFWLPAEKMNKHLVSSVVGSTQRAGFSARLATPHASIVTAKINGYDLLSFARDYVIGGVKVTFFSRLDNPFKAFVLQGKTVGDILHGAELADPAVSTEYAKEVLIGGVPLDKEDEGFDSIGVQEKITDIYSFFSAAINEHEQSEAAKIYTEIACKACRAIPCACQHSRPKPK